MIENLRNLTSFYPLFLRGKSLSHCPGVFNTTPTIPEIVRLSAVFSPPFFVDIKYARHIFLIIYIICKIYAR